MKTIIRDSNQKSFIQFAQGLSHSKSVHQFTNMNSKSNNEIPIKINRLENVESSWNRISRIRTKRFSKTSTTNKKKLLPSPKLKTKPFSNYKKRLSKHSEHPNHASKLKKKINNSRKKAFNSQKNHIKLPLSALIPIEHPRNSPSPKPIPRPPSLQALKILKNLRSPLIPPNKHHPRSLHHPIPNPNPKPKQIKNTKKHKNKQISKTHKQNENSRQSNHNSTWVNPETEKPVR